MDNLRKLSHWLSTTSYDALVLARRDSYKWIMEGNDNSVVTNVATGVAYIVVFNSDSVRPIVICDNSDASRIDKEQSRRNAYTTESLLTAYSSEVTNEF